jgi:hypothetical protein
VVFWLWIALTVVAVPSIAVGLPLAALYLYARSKARLRPEGRKS